MSSSDIIGQADGPTTLYIYSTVNWYAVAALILIIIAAAAFILRAVIKRKRRK